MAPIGDQELDKLDSPFHKNLMGNVDGLFQHLEELVTHLDCREEAGKSSQNTAIDADTLWNKTTGSFNAVLGGLQAFVTGLRYEYSNLEREVEELEGVKKTLESEKDDMVEKTHELHCRIQYSALEMKLDQSFGDIERCSSVDSARCFKDEALENLRRTKEITRTANLRNCQLDNDIFYEMEHITTTFEEYQKERETFVAELDLFDDVRKRKISNWMKDSGRSGAERELGENILEYLELNSSRRHLEPKIISNTLRMQSLNELLAFDRNDNIKRLDEMTSLQKRVEDMTGLSNILLRKTPATTDLTTGGDGLASYQKPSHEDDSNHSDFQNGREDRDVTSGHGLHRCPRKIHLATDPVTDPVLCQELESALRWEFNDGLQLSLSSADMLEDAAVVEAACTGTMTGGDPATDGGTPTTTSEDLQDPVSVISRRSESGQENEGDGVETVVDESATSLCGDAVLSQEKLAPTVNETLAGHNHHHHHSPDPHAVSVVGHATESPMPRSSHLLQHHVESATGMIGSPCQQKLMFGLVKKKSCGGPSSMTAIVDSEKEASGRTTYVSQKMAAADDRETRSQGWASIGGRVGSSGTSSNSGNPRN